VLITLLGLGILCICALVPILIIVVGLGLTIRANRKASMVIDAKAEDSPSTPIENHDPLNCLRRNIFLHANKSIITRKAAQMAAGSVDTMPAFPIIQTPHPRRK
jgi:hypothetical protein